MNTIISDIKDVLIETAKENPDVAGAIIISLGTIWMLFNRKKS
ncbi:hypothetical protein [Gallibacterium genomosp. 3]|nr:hypothetical protein [Gallibacterium genomosp. 3]